LATNGIHNLTRFRFQKLLEAGFFNGVSREILENMNLLARRREPAFGSLSLEGREGYRDLSSLHNYCFINLERIDLFTLFHGCHKVYNLWNALTGVKTANVKRQESIVSCEFYSS